MQTSIFVPHDDQPAVSPQIGEGWKEALDAEFRSEYFPKLKAFLVDERKKCAVYPPGSLIFAAFNHTPFSKVKVVIIGQDPYHGKGQANGLCFSVSPGIRQPPSLANIFRELKNDLGIERPVSGDLTPWARRGVLLLNATLTVRAGEPGSHQGQGWETFTDAAIRALSERRDGLVFLLWGKFAKNKETLIDKGKHHVLTAAHPSPFSADYGFFGCRHFSRANELLRRQGKEEIDWRTEPAS